MALVLPTVGDRIVMTVQFQDENGQLSNRQVEVPFDTDLATTFANGAAVAASMAAASKCFVPKAFFSIEAVEDTDLTPAAGANVYFDGRISVTLLEGAESKDEYGQISIPDPSPTLAPSGSDRFIIDINDALITAVLAHFQTGGSATLSDGQEVNAALKGRIYPKKGKPR